MAQPTFYWPIAWPQPKPIPTGYQFGRPRSGHTHKGIDLGGPAMGGAEGDPVRAAAAGTVKVAQTVRPGGIAIYIDHEDGWQTRYFHLQAGSLRVKRGDKVTAGAHIANVGRTGIQRSPAHLHFEIRNPGGVAVDPRTLLQQRGAVEGVIGVAAITTAGVLWWMTRG